NVIADRNAKNVAVCLDCCYSGAAGKAFAGIRSTVEDQLVVSQQSGVHILTSSTSIETSREREHDEDGGVMGNFTRCLLEGIASGEADANNDSEISLRDLYNYAKDRITGQHPSYWPPTPSGDLTFARNPNVLPEALPDEVEAALTNHLAGVRQGVVR